MSTSVYVADIDPPSPRLKQRDAARTRSAILQAAQAAFAVRGYGETGLREVAAAAGVNSALVGRYFGSKERLFEAALGEALDVSPLLLGPRASFGRDVVALFFASQDVPSPLTMMILSAADPAPRAISVRLLQSQVVAPLAAWLGGPEAEARAARLNVLWSGFLMAWKLLPLEPLAEARIGSTRRWLEDATQAIVDAPVSPRGRATE